MFNRKAKIVKKWRNNQPPDIPIQTSEQLKFVEDLYNLVAGTLDKDMREAGITEDSAEGVELMSIRAGLFRHFEDVRKKFEEGQ